ncbi:MAG: preprotein translocase subunit SecG [Candidatus Adiutrix sp.]|nr:preprotein translocase subunit SecG [Candidatus Adiutrix sp.]
MNTAVIFIHVLAVVVLVLTVLLQAGKGAGMGAAFGGASGSVFGARGPATLIGRITCGAAVVFMCTSLFLAISQSGRKTESVMSGYAEAPAAKAETAPAAPAQAEANPAGQGAAEKQTE